jgi:acetolactate synthase-1/2/3 large subunit
MQPPSGAHIISDFLERRGVRVVAGMPGGANLPLYDALTRSRLKHVLVRHEQAAGFIAQGIARVSGRAGVCFATSGPGATNLLTALADARLDSIPVVAITGQVPTALIGTDAFQEVDTVAIFKPVVKHARLVKHTAELWDALEEAFRIAESGRPGPVLIDVPKDVQQGRADIPPERAPRAEEANEALTSAQLEHACAMLAAAERPVLYIGGGAIQSGAHADIVQLAEQLQLPVVASLMGLGCMPPEHPLFCGMLGMHAAPYTNLLLRECDLLVALGVRFDDRATGKLAEFCPRARTIHVDIDARELGKLRRLELGVRADVGTFVRALAPLASSAPPERGAWLARIAALRARHGLPRVRYEDPEQMSAQAVLEHVGARLAADTVITTDVGQHQMWVAQWLPIRGPRRLLTSGGLGSMGFGLPAAIGAALETGGRVLCVSGDGSLLLNIHELATLAELALDVTILLFDNQHLGLVRQQQMLFYEQRLSASRFERATDFVAVAQGFGIAASAWEPRRELLAQLDRLLDRSGPQLIRVPLSAAEMVLPMVPPGAGNHEMLGAGA